ncbi:MAG TPA: DUF4393 domain-containing protein [Geobacteraceae bacterium]|nr:DUF4393 domain-containing protein [Geobacteraceae bacterium]
MDNDKQIQEVAQALGLGSVLPSVYNDLLAPAARELGDGLATIAKAVKAALAPIEATVWGYDKIRQWLSVRVTKILADRKANDIISPPLSISGPLTLQMIFAAEEPDLREMYANLLASAMDAKTASDAHPSFVSLIQQLTSDEAKIMNRIAALKADWPCWTGKQAARPDTDDDIWDQLRHFCLDANLDCPDNVMLYIENLIRIRLLEHVTGSEAKYYPEGGDDHGTWGAGVATESWELVQVTEYGRAFIAACIPRG